MCVFGSLLRRSSESLNIFSLQKSGCIIVETEQTIIVAVFGDGTQAPEAAVQVEGFGDYLRSQHF